VASIPTHMLCGAAVGLWFARTPQVGRALTIGALCAALPDLDGVGYRLGVPYEAMLGHRGLSHSLFFAAALATAGVVLLPERWRGGLSRGSLWLLVAITTASHGVLDAATSGGLGVAFIAPFDGTRWFLPWRPIRVSPMSIRGFVSARGVAILMSEARWVWAPSALLAVTALLVRRTALSPLLSPAVRKSDGAPG
jgi:inner membrane protein